MRRSFYFLMVLLAQVCMNGSWVFASQINLHVNQLTSLSQYLKVKADLDTVLGPDLNVLEKKISKKETEWVIQSEVSSITVEDIQKRVKAAFELPALKNLEWGIQ